MADLLRISLTGALPSGENWSVNPIYRFTAPLAISSDECAAVAAEVNTVTLGSSLTGLNPSTWTLTGCRVEARDLNGELESVAEAARGTAVVGTSSVVHPLQTSIVLSLRTTDSTARGKGRLYWPALGMAIDTTTARFSAVGVDNFITGMNTYLAAIRAEIRSIGGMSSASLAVWSRTTPKVAPVVTLKAGNVPDVQRRRRDKVVESYLTADVAA